MLSAATTFFSSLIFIAILIVYAIAFVNGWREETRKQKAFKAAHDKWFLFDKRDKSKVAFVNKNGLFIETENTYSNDISGLFVVKTVVINERQLYVIGFEANEIHDKTKK